MIIKAINKSYFVKPKHYPYNCAYGIPHATPLIYGDFFGPSVLSILTYHGYCFKHGICDSEHLSLYVIIDLHGIALPHPLALVPYCLE